ncbi:MAG: bifunctional glutamate N-acetyltransferase/amino-acid acetyltransferase ArgJ [Desulfobacteraceae bacterium]|nr:MAG: bifunctional glutamate N-acetyltransferase/amino-acid acetyltransferase ArgJ [Desulfobacteraceae bacterium]
MVQGFKASAVKAGLKKDKGLDLALIFSERETAVAGVFTTNKVVAAPVILTREHIKSGRSRAIIANAGNANACTGKAGFDDARRTAELVADRLGIGSDEVLVASTGVIGQPLNVDRIAEALPALVERLSPDGIPTAARAIMTTDSFAKISHFEGHAGGRPYRILGVAKGAGMIMPNMATMLCFIVSDIRIDSHDLNGALFSSVETTFNRITVDGDTSTNDTVLVMANGMAGNTALTEADSKGFARGLETVMGELAQMIVRDGEGATKVIHMEIKGAHSASDALKAARTVGNSSLVKTACYGQDPNWGRIMAALGRADIVMDEEKVDIWVNDILIVSAGLGKGQEAEKKAAEIMVRKEYTITIDVHQGDFEDRIITCDLTHEYVSINASYRT